ncbi:MAG: VanZ family protein [Clostridia bacterium]|nr:VanZ family protein [Clostridia bacterium]
MKRVLKRLMPLLTFLVIAFILSNSLSNGTQANAKRGFVVEIVQEVVSLFAGDRPEFTQQHLAVFAKCFHVLEFALFSFCLTWSVILLGDYQNGRFERILLCGMALALADEHLQTLSVGRGPALTDVFVDLSGVMIGYAVVMGIAFFIKKHENKKQKGT